MKIRALREQRDGSVNTRRAAPGSLIASRSFLALLPGLLALLSYIPTAAAALLEDVHVNYAHNWVAGHTEVGVEVLVTVNDEDDGLKGETTVSANEFGDFFVDCPAYDPDPCPDINPGDTVIVSATGLEHRIEPVGWIEGMPDALENTVGGTLDADWLTGPVPVRCEVWGPPGPPTIDTSADPDGGTFSCDFDDVGWDLQRGDMVALTYFEPDGDRVTNIVVWPWMRVNYAHDWAGGNYPGGHSVTVTVWEAVVDACSVPVGSVKAEAQVNTEWSAGWGEDGFQTAPWHWSPAMPDILPGDTLEFVGDLGFCRAVNVGEIAADLDVAADTVTGTVDAPWLTGPVPVECHPWGAGFPLPPKITSVEPDGIDTFTCDWSGEWDILPGEDVAVMYIEPDDDDMVINVVHEPAPHLAINKWARGAPAAGGNLMFSIQYQNLGDGPAEDVVITDTPEVLVGETPVLGGMSYVADTSGLPVTIHGDGHFEWDVGTVAPGEVVEFQLYVEVTALVDDVIRNTVHIETTSYDPGPPEEKTAMWEGPVLENDTHVNVSKESWTPDPAPGDQVIFSIGVCNPGQTGSTELTLTDTLGDGLTLDNWWPEHPGWSETSSGEGGFTLTTPSIPGTECRGVLVRANVEGTVSPGAELTNTAVIIAANDMESEDNEWRWSGFAGEPHLNLWIVKRLNRGVLVPGGELYYNLPYGNNGNQTAAPVLIVDTLPVGTSLVSAWHSGFLGDFEIVPVTIAPEYVVWELPELPGGVSGNIEVHLAIDPAAFPDTELTNTAEICGPPAEPPELCDPIPGEDTYDDNVATWTELLNAAGPNLRIIKRSVWQNDEVLLYILRFQNIGDQTIPDVAIVDTLPGKTVWDTWWDVGFDPGRLAGGPTYDSGVLTWNFSELHPGEDGRIRFNAVLDGSQQPLEWIENNAQITVPAGDTNPDDNFDSTTNLWGNQCGGEHVVLFEETYAGEFWCLAPGSITASSVTVTGSGQVILKSPLIAFENGLAVEPGGTLSVGAP
jgi:uncharacterized repeat protein (TIGR01451 family)